MPRDPIQAANALARVQIAEAKSVEAQEERRLAILDAVRAGNPLRDIAGVARCSRETIRRFVAEDGQVTIELDGHGYLLAGQTIDVVLYRLQGFARGAFGPNPAVHGTDTAWLASADGLAGQIEASRADARGEPVVLTDETAFALHQAMLQSAKTNPSALLDLTEDLRTKYPRKAP